MASRQIKAGTAHEADLASNSRETGDTRLLLAHKGGQETWLAPLIAQTLQEHTWRYKKTSCHRLVEVKIQICFLKATTQGMLVQQNQACCIIPLNDSSPYTAYATCSHHITEL